jgi:hypothetical protein
MSAWILIDTYVCVCVCVSPHSELLTADASDERAIMQAIRGKLPTRHMRHIDSIHELIVLEQQMFL